MLFDLAIASPKLIVFAAALLGTFAWIAVNDARTMLIDDWALVIVLMLALFWRFTSPEAFGLIERVVAPLTGGIICGALILAVREGFFRIRTYEGIGFGDVKLSAVLGVLLGVTGFSWALLLASLVGLAGMWGLRGLAGFQGVDRVPFATLLAPAAWVVWVWQALPLMGVW